MRVGTEDALESGVSYVPRARKLLARGDTDPAQALGHLTAQPPSWEVSLLKVCVHALSEDRDGARAELKTLLGMDMPSLHPLRRVLLDLGSQRLKLAEDLLAAALADRPTARPLLTAQAMLERLRSNRKLARAERSRDPAEAEVNAAREDGLKGDWSGAAARLGRYLDSGAEPGSAGQMLALAKLYAASEDPAGEPRRLDSVDLRYINLDVDRERRERIEGAFAACGLLLDRQGGVPGATLPLWAFEKLSTRRTGRPGAQPGTLGVFLSHLSVWEKVARASRPSLVLEDDATPLFRFGATLERIVGQTRDLCFVNNRLSNKLGPHIPQPEAVEVHPLEPWAHAYTGPRTAGGDGYVLTPDGARKLLDYVAEDGWLGHVDIQLLSYCVPPATGDEEGRLRRYWSQHAGPRAIQASVAYPPLIQHMDHGRSSRRGD